MFTDSISTPRLQLFSLGIVCLVLIAGGRTGHAAQPPLSQAEIDSQSAAVVVVDVLGVVYEAEYGPGTRAYVAWVQVHEVIKGDLQRQETFLTSFTTIGPQAGGIHVVMHPGERLRVALAYDEGNPMPYRVWHQDGWKVLRRGTAALPGRVGEVALASATVRHR